MAFAGPLIGPAFALEGYAFFIEAIFLGLYLYGWDRLSPRAHWLCGLPVVISGAFSGIIVLATVSWMHAPTGFEIGPDGLPTNIQPLAAIFNSAYPLMATHSTLSTYQAVGFAAAGAYAFALIRNSRPHRVHYNAMAVTIAMAVALPAALAQPVVGDFLGKRAYHEQPAKLAALEGQFETRRHAPLRIGGWPDPETGQTRWAIEIPSGLSILATWDPNAEVLGLEAFPRDQWPPTQIVHPAFQVMVGAGLAMLGLGLWFWAAWWLDRRAGRGWRGRKWLLRAMVLATPLGFLALEAGWIVTEVGRQPWIIYGVMRTATAVTTAPGVALTFAGFVALYTGLMLTLVFLMRRRAAEEDLAEMPREVRDAA
jgi:cytochrome d ubiquinol oxidase subunit I